MGVPGVALRIAGTLGAAAALLPWAGPGRAEPRLPDAGPWGFDPTDVIDQRDDTDAEDLGATAADAGCDRRPPTRPPAAELAGLVLAVGAARRQRRLP